MANRINQLLQHWSTERDSCLWVLATIIETDGSSYRKPGAMMLINDQGQYFGLLSGGCLESDIMLQARRCWEDHKNRIVEYDMREEEDLAWQLGIGCGGMVRILLQPVHQDNQYLQLDDLQHYLAEGKTLEYHQQVSQHYPNNHLVVPDGPTAPHVGKLTSIAEQNFFIHALRPAPVAAVFGAGVDARPLVAMAAQLGWQILLIDPRVGYAKHAYFTEASQIIRTPLDELDGKPWLQRIDMAFILTHNIKLDAESLKLVQSSNAKYVGLLGPIHRTDRVLDFAELHRSQLVKPLYNPVGLRLGGELPESIALSMLAEAHAVLENADGQSISGLL